MKEVCIMKTKQIIRIVYETIDEKQFDTIEEAEKHENKLLESFPIEKLAKQIKIFCRNCNCDRGTQGEDACPFNTKNGCALETFPEDWKI